MSDEAILARIRAIPPGFVRAYGDVSPGAPRRAGAVLHDTDEPGLPWWRVVRADGSLVGRDVRGSIHQVGAALEGAPSCNGWTYWHFRRDGQMFPIDILRQQIRAELAAAG